MRHRFQRTSLAPPGFALDEVMVVGESFRSFAEVDRLGGDHDLYRTRRTNHDDAFKAWIRAAMVALSVPDAILTFAPPTSSSIAAMAGACLAIVFRGGGGGSTARSMTAGTNIGGTAGSAC